MLYKHGIYADIIRIEALLYLCLGLALEVIAEFMWIYKQLKNG